MPTNTTPSKRSCCCPSQRNLTDDFGGRAGVPPAGSACILSRVLTRRFGVLTDAIRKMREGSYSHRAEVGGHDEISELAAEFNDMADRLQTTEDARRRFVSDASHELNKRRWRVSGFCPTPFCRRRTWTRRPCANFVGDIEQESERLARITENLLRLTRLTAAHAARRRSASTSRP
ncbi:MAG: HAMP domain-containing protein [Oscillibacter sp.]